jgi:glucose/arabinose dehydrogenase
MKTRAALHLGVHSLLPWCLATALCAVAIVACQKNNTTQPPAVTPPPSTPPPSGNTTISLNPSVTHQTMTAWEVPVIRTVLDYTPILPFMNTVMDLAVNDLGLNGIAIGVAPGMETTSNCESDYLNGLINEAGFIQTCNYTATNDNADPFVINPNGFRYTLLDWQIDKILLPMKQRVEARGEKLRVVIRWVDFGVSAFEHYQSPDEYAEFMLAVFDHIKSKYGFVPDAIDAINEGDSVAGYTATVVGNLIARTGARLAAAGYAVYFIAPSAVDMSRAAPYIDQILAVAGARQYTKEISWHCYAGYGAAASAAIASRTLQYGINSSMTECWGTANTYQMLHQELKTSRNSAWQLGAINSSNGYYDPSSGQAVIRPKAQYIRQYYKYVRAGARRIDAVTANAAFDPVAFINTEGKYVVIVRASSGGSFSIGNLPSGTYGVFYTTGPDGLTVSNYNVNLPDQTLSGGQALTTSIPGTGVITVYAKTGGSAGLDLAVDTMSTADRTPPPTIASTEAPSRSRPTWHAWPGSTTVTTTKDVQLTLQQVADGIGEPIDLAFTPDGRLFVAERDGRIRVVREGRLLPQPALALPEAGDGEEQLLAIAVDPSFERTRFVYAISTIRSTSGAPTFRLARFREAANTLADRSVLLDDIAAAAKPSASLRFGADGKLFAAFDEAGVTQLGGDLSSPNGKLLRLNPDGTTPDDQAGGTPLFAYAYHSPRGFDWHPTTQTLWMADRDASDTSMLSVLAASVGPRKRGELRATLTLPRGTSASSVAFYHGGSSAALRDNLLVASEEGRHLLRIQLDRQEPTRIVATERLLQDVIGGIRVVTVGPDGAIYLGAMNALWRLAVVDR